jgi:hypothetical protein
LRWPPELEAPTTTISPTAVSGDEPAWVGVALDASAAAASAARATPALSAISSAAAEVALIRDWRVIRKSPWGFRLLGALSVPRR